MDMCVCKLTYLTYIFKVMFSVEEIARCLNKYTWEDE